MYKQIELNSKLQYININKFLVLIKQNKESYTRQF